MVVSFLLFGFTCPYSKKGDHLLKTWPISSIPSQLRLQWAAFLGPGSASVIGFQSAWRQEVNNRYGVQSVISAIILGNKRVAAKPIRHMPLQPVNSDVI